MTNRFGGLPEYDPRRDDSPSSIDAIKRAIALSPIRKRNRQPRQGSQGPVVNRFLFKQDHRARLPSWLGRFIGYRKEEKGPYDPIAPLSFLKSVPMKYEVWVLGWIASFVGILLILSIFATHTAFRDTFHSPLVVASFGATAVLIYGAVESPLSQPRNVFGGQIFSAIVAVAITRLFVKDPAYIDHLDNTAFHPAIFINGALCMATAMLVMTMTGTVHPPGGATALIASLDAKAVRLSWRFVPGVIASTCLIFGWAMIINNIGRRKYPQYWWAPGRQFVVDPATMSNGDEEMADTIANKSQAGQEGRNKEASQQGRPEVQAGQNEPVARGRFDRSNNT